ncbi:hypothetical protein KBTX_03274 [wastewater metagenome]|uniref:WbqC-like protein family n=2 Tax=unclassified sequences TaxID=12908 RepID=A0A5B8REA5_9ZZZZ|nr:WbqC family protein [Arhodomonas sp. KWT]QEA06931.1 putative protein [uncultured organism]
MTTVAIMQPYLFPYIGYYQLVAAADIFVFLDDVNFIKRGFVNRNQVIDSKGNVVRFTLPVRKASQNRHIREHSYANDNGKALRTIEHCYKDQPGFHTWHSLVREILGESAECSVSSTNETSIKKPLINLPIKTQFFRSSELDPQPTLTGENRILHLCGELGADRYINLPGGKSLYDPGRFASQGVELLFLCPPDTPPGIATQPSFLHHLMTLDEMAIHRQLNAIEFQ